MTMHARLSKQLGLCLLAATMSACGYLPLPGLKEAPVGVSVTETGVSPTSSRSALWLAAVRPGLSASAKDYLFVGPMTVNREGARRGYLWFGAGTTIDRHITGADKPVLDTVILVADGTPMTFDLIPWDNNPATSPYPLAIDHYASYAARVTTSQLRQLGNASELGAYVTDVNGRSPLYQVVEGSAGDWIAGGNLAASNRD